MVGVANGLSGERMWAGGVERVGGGGGGGGGELEASDEVYSRPRNRARS